MSTLKIDLEDDITELLRQLNQPLERAVKEFVVLELYRRGSLSGSRAAELLGMSRGDFSRHADDLGIPFFSMTAKDWDDESAASARL